MHAFLNTLALKLYPNEMEKGNSVLQQSNAIMAIGYISCTLKDMDNVTAASLTTLQQRFRRPPSSNLDELITEQFADILLTGLVRT